MTVSTSSLFASLGLENVYRKRVSPSISGPRFLFEWVSVVSIMDLRMFEKSLLRLKMTTAVLVSLQLRKTAPASGTLKRGGRSRAADPECLLPIVVMDFSRDASCIVALKLVRIQRSGSVSMPGRIFVNYRRCDDPGFTQALYMRLEAEFTADDLFTAPVGSFPPNPWGLYDMHGNVWEWVEDPYHDTYAGAPVDGSVWSSGRSYSRVLRGGSWYALADALRSANRSFGSPDYRNNAVGFRVARTL
jgi:Sulfatase-modifying factor enzyme 1